MDKNELEWKKHEAELEWQKQLIKSQNLKFAFDLVKHALTLATILGAIYIAFNTFLELAKARPETLKALAEFAEKFKIGTVVMSIVATIGGIGWYYERKGKKRAIKNLRNLREKLEENDPHNEGSGLDENGHTPKREGN